VERVGMDLKGESLGLFHNFIDHRRAGKMIMRADG
jgi:hypothetical protein